MCGIDFYGRNSSLIVPGNCGSDVTLHMIQTCGKPTYTFIEYLKVMRAFGTPLGLPLPFYHISPNGSNAIVAPHGCR